MFQAFNEQGTQLRFQRGISNQSYNSSNIRNFPEDRLVKIVDVFLNSNSSKSGHLIVQEEETGIKFSVTISEKTLKNIKPQSNGGVNSYSGGFIDDLFLKASKQYKYAVLTSTKYTKKKEIIDGEEIRFIETDWIVLLRSYSSEKVRKTLFTVWAYNPYVDQHISTVQDWGSLKQPKVIGITLDNFEKIEEQAKEFDDLAAKWDEIRKLRSQAGDDANEKKKYQFPALKGFYLRTLKISETSENDNGELKVVPEYIVVNTLIPIVRDTSEQNKQGEKVKSSQVITGKYFVDILTRYINYACANFSEQDPSTYNLEDEENPSLPKDILVEVIIFTEYFANNMGNKYTVLNNPNSTYEFKTALQRMAQKQTKPEHDTPEGNYYAGMNLAVNGIVVLTDDVVDTESKTFITRNNVKAIFANGPKQNINFFIPCSLDGRRVRLSDDLRTKEELEVRNRYQQSDDHSQDNSFVNDSQVSTDTFDDDTI